MDTGAIERLTGAKGALDEEEGVFKVSVPRKDLSVIVAGVKMSPPMGLTSWAAFKRAGKFPAQFINVSFRCPSPRSPGAAWR